MQAVLQFKRQSILPPGAELHLPLGYGPLQLFLGCQGLIQRDVLGLRTRFRPLPLQTAALYPGLLV